MLGGFYSQRQCRRPVPAADKANALRAQALYMALADQVRHDLLSDVDDDPQVIFEN